MIWEYEYRYCIEINIGIQIEKIQIKENMSRIRFSQSVCVQSVWVSLCTATEIESHTQLQFTAGLHQVCHTKEPGFVQFWLLGPRGTIISSPETLRRHCGITLEAKTHMVSILLCKLKQHCWPKYQLIFEDVKKKKKII